MKFDQFSPFETSENLALSLVPIAVAPVTMRMLTRPAMRQYSIAVAPEVSQTKRRITERMTNPQNHSLSPKPAELQSGYRGQ